MVTIMGTGESGIAGEPARRRPLRWGLYPDRYVAAIVLLVASAVALPSGNTFAIFQIVFGLIGGLVGWFVLPGRLGRRIAAVVPAGIGVAALIIGPQGLPFLVLPLLAWLWVRERSALSYLAALPLLVVGVLMASTFGGWSDMPFAYAVTAATFVGCAWLARTISRARVTTSDGRGPVRLPAG